MKLKYLTLAILIFSSLNLIACNKNTEIKEENTISSEVNLNKDVKDMKNYGLKKEDFLKVENYYNIEKSNSEIISLYETNKLNVYDTDKIKSFLDELNLKDLIVDKFEVKVDDINKSLILTYKSDLTLNEDQIEILSNYISILIFYTLDELTVLDLRINDFQCINGYDYPVYLVENILDSTK